MKNKKLVLFSILVCSFLFICVLIPSLAKLVTSKNNVNVEWDGSIASSFNSGNGTEESPYIISNESEFAYFKESLKKDNFENKYIKITNDIILNAGLFKKDDNLKYIKDDVFYYLDSNTNKYYEDASLKNYVASINEFEMLNSFNGSLDGGSHTIYGLFIKGDNSSLFESLSGNISNLVIENAYIYGENSSSGLALNSNGSIINNVIIDGNILSGNNTNDDLTINEEIMLNSNINLSAGLIVKAVDSVFENIVNRANIENSIASGLIGVIKNSNISKSYNLGNINGETTSGITDTIISSRASLTYVYNEGNLSNTSSGLIRNIIDSTIDISYSYNTFNTSAYRNKENSNLSVSNSYNKIPDSYFLTFNKNTIKELFNTEDFINEESPLLKLDYETQKYVNIILKNNTWNTFKENVDYISLNEDLSFILVSTKDYKAIKDVYYYLSEDELTKNDLDSVNWTSYESPIGIDKKGTYILYVKVVNYNDDSYYLNTDRVFLYVDNIYAKVKVDGLTWDDLHDTDYVFINNKKFEIKAYGKNDIKSIEYLTTSKVLDSSDLETSTSWIKYREPVNIISNSIVYVKVEDKDSNIIYLNSDHFIDEKYSITNLKSGKKTEFNSDMTYNSSISFNVELDSDITLEGFTRSLVSNEVLPINTHIVISDLIKNKIYEYYTDETTEKEISLTKFSEVGLTSKVFFLDSDINKEKLNIIIDFNNINETNQEYSIIFKAKRVSDEITSDCLNFKLVSSSEDINNNLSITKRNNISSIKYNSVSTTNVTFNTSLNNKYLNTSLEDLDSVLIIEVLDKDGNLVDKENYKGLKFIYKTKNYSPNNINKTIIKIDDINNTSDALTIKTSEDISGLLDGENTLRISLGLTFNNLVKNISNNSISIPIVVNKKNSYSFGISLDKRIVTPKDLFKFKIISSLDNPTINVSLFKKKERNGANQEYTEVQLSDYINESIESVSKGETQVSFKDSVEKNSYMFKFDLYDGDTFIGQNSIKVVVR